MKLVVRYEKNREVQGQGKHQGGGCDGIRTGAHESVNRKGGREMKNIVINKREMLTALEMALAFVVPIWGGMYIVARLWG